MLGVGYVKPTVYCMSRFAYETVSLCGECPQVQIHLNTRVSLVVAAISYLDNVKVPANCVRPKPGEKCLGDRISEPEKNKFQPIAIPYLEVSVVGEFVQVSHNTKRIVDRKSVG